MVVAVGLVMVKSGIFCKSLSRDCNKKETVKHSGVTVSS